MAGKIIATRVVCSSEKYTEKDLVDLLPNLKMARDYDQPEEIDFPKMITIRLDDTVKGDRFRVLLFNSVEERNKWFKIFRMAVKLNGK